jgi:hypothetical protein
VNLLQWQNQQDGAMPFQQPVILSNKSMMTYKAESHGAQQGTVLFTAGIIKD